MEVRTLVKKGIDHLVYCEDDLFFREQGNVYVGAVFDGCSTGYKSHFASSLLSHLLKKACNGIIDDKAMLSEMGILLFHNIFSGLKDIQSLLMLRDIEMVSTMIICLIRNNKCFIISSGDGCIKCDDKLIVIESPGNAPDYLAYHLGLSSIEVLAKSVKQYEFEFEKGVSICTDGILSFRSSLKEDVSSEVIDYLLNDIGLIKSDAMLSRKYNLLIKKGYENFDDVSIVRFIR